MSTERCVAKAKPRPKLVVNLFSNFVPIHERRWIDIDTQPFHHSCFVVSKFRTRTLRHDSSVLREDDGAVRLDDLIDKFKVEFVGTMQWTVDSWVNCLAKGGGVKKRFQYCSNSFSSIEFLYFRAIQRHLGGNLVNPFVQDNVLLPDNFTENIYHIGNAFEMHSVIKSGLIPGANNLRSESQSIFFTAVNPMCARRDLEEVQYDLDKPRIAPYKHTWGAHHNTEKWCNGAI